MSETTESAGKFETVEYTTEGGPDLGLGLHERETRLRIDLGTGLAFLNRHQPTSTEGGEPLGTFRATVVPDLVSSLQMTLAHANLGQIASGTGGGPGTSLIRIRAKRGQEILAASFSSRDMDTLEKLDGLLSLLDDAVGSVAQHPFQAIRLDIQVQHTQAVVFAVKLKNVGTETVAVPDLEMLGRESNDVRDHGIGVRVAPNPPERPGYTSAPLAWSRVEPASLSRAPGKPMILPPGGEQVIQTVAWTGHGPALAQAFFSFYGGPAVVEGHLMVRGHAMSTGVELAQ
jgi:hypothetical protein